MNTPNKLTILRIILVPVFMILLLNFNMLAVSGIVFVIASLTDLADYLSIDRSAMMRELRIMKDEGIIEKSGNRITLLY